MQKLEDWLTHLEARYTTRPVKLGLTRIQAVAERLDLKPEKPLVITVAGTNGKGSTVAALEAVYLAAGYRVGVYTSPHLLQFNERIRLNGQMITDEQLMSAFTQVHAAEAGLSALTYFEFITLTALRFFKQQPLDLVILEVGLGGRLDATNIIDADLAILTTIDFDHQAYLGDTREAIGFEKAGILRPQQRCIFASNNPPTTVLEVANQLQVQLCRFGVDYGYIVEKAGGITYWAKAAGSLRPQAASQRQESYTGLTKNDKMQGKNWGASAVYTAVHEHCEPIFNAADCVFRKSYYTLPRPILHPEAICAAISATMLLQDELPVKQEAINALAEVSLAGRLQYLPGTIEVLLDVAHNEQSARRLSLYLQERHSEKRLLAVFSALADKAISNMVSILSENVKVWHVAALKGPRAASEAQLVGAFGNYPEAKVLWYNSVSSAFLGAKTQAQAGRDLILVFGSFLTVAAVLEEHKHEVSTR